MSAEGASRRKRYSGELYKAVFVGIGRAHNAEINQFQAREVWRN
jgi:hypothetical protein